MNQCPPHFYRQMIVEAQSYFVAMYAMQPLAAQFFQELCLKCATMEGFPPPQANRKYPSNNWTLNSF